VVVASPAKGTIVYQSYRTTGVPAWIDRCMATVRDWATLQGHAYRFYDDAFLDRAPAWFREKSEHLCPVTDLARLVVARELLAEGWERVVWIDADMLVFDPARFDIAVPDVFAFSHEAWVQADNDGQVQCRERVNNAAMVFHRDNVHLEFFIDAALRSGRSLPVIGKLDIGTRFLSQLFRLIPFMLLGRVGTFSPLLMQEIAAGTQACPGLTAFAARLKIPLACANLCASLGSTTGPQAGDTQALYHDVIDRCLRERGAFVNRLRTAHRP
jgi:hypothetical protein